MLDRTLIDRYLSHLVKERRLSPHTSSNYARDLAALAEYFERANVRDWKTVDSQHVRMFAARSHAGGLNPRSVQRRLSATRGFFNYLAREGAVKGNPALDVRAPKAAKRLPGTLDVDTINQLLDIPPTDALAVRDKALMELFYSSGLRLAELVGLDLMNMDLADRTVRVLGKGSKTRIVPVGGPALEALARWLPVRDRLAAAGEPALFVGRSGRRLAPREVQRRIKRRAALAGLGVDVHPHMLRHSFASHVLQSSGDLRAVQEMLGHASIASTQVYTHLDFQHLAKVYDAAHPRARRKR
jgi:integrase/recombinase XerC